MSSPGDLEIAELELLALPAGRDAADDQRTRRGRAATLDGEQRVAVDRSRMPELRPWSP